jgi:acyl carrier protein
MGGSALESSVALEALERLLLTDRSEVGVLAFDWKTLSRLLPTAGSPRFVELARRAGGAEAEAVTGESIERLLAELSDEELLGVFTEMLKQEVGDIMRTSPAKIDPHRSLYEMGLDSLMGVELVVALESRFGISLPVMALSGTPTLHKLAQRILTLLRGSAQEDDAAAAAAAALQERVRQAATQHGAEVGADDIARFADDIGSRDPNRVNRTVH